MLKISKLMFAAAVMSVPVTAIAAPVPAAVVQATTPAPLMTAARPAVSMTVAWSVEGVSLYGPVKCGPNGCHEEIRPW